MEKYNFKCSVCGHVLTADTENDEEASEKLMEMGKKHMEEVHPEMPMDPEMEKMVKEQMKKGEMDTEKGVGY